MSLKEYAGLVEPKALAQAESLMTLPKANIQIDSQPVHELATSGITLRTPFDAIRLPKHEPKSSPIVVASDAELVEAIKCKYDSLVRKDGRVAVLLGGPSGIGKTSSQNTVSETLTQLGHPNATLLGADDFMRTRRGDPLREAAHLPPELFLALRLECAPLIEELVETALATRESVTLATEFYDHSSGEIKQGTRTVEKDQSFSVDGVLINGPGLDIKAHDPSARIINITLLDPNTKRLLSQLIARDLKHGRTLADAIKLRIGELPTQLKYLEKVAPHSDIVRVAPDRYQQFSFFHPRS